MKISQILVGLALPIAFFDGVLIDCQETVAVEEVLGMAEADNVQEEVAGDGVAGAQEDVSPQTEGQQQEQKLPAEPVQAGPLIDLLGTKLDSLKLVDERSAEIRQHYTNEALAGKRVIGLYFSADWYVFGAS
jgi:hypothetical protein